MLTWGPRMPLAGKEPSLFFPDQSQRISQTAAALNLTQTPALFFKDCATPRVPLMPWTYFCWESLGSLVRMQFVTEFLT